MAKRSPTSLSRRGEISQADPDLEQLGQRVQHGQMDHLGDLAQTDDADFNTL